MPTEFFLNQAEYDITYQQPPEIVEEFSALGLARYSSFANDTMNFPYGSFYDAPDPPQWNTTIPNRFLDVSWKYFDFLGPSLKMVAFRDLERYWVLGFEGFNIKEWLNVNYEGQSLGPILRTTVEEYFPDEQNVTLMVSGNFISADIILYTDEANLLDGWDADVLSYSINWEIDFDAMKPDVWTLVAQLISFQNPDFGLPDEINNVVSASFTMGLMIVIAILIYTLVTRLIPTLQGGIEN